MMCSSGVLVHTVLFLCCHNPPISEMDYMTFNVAYVHGGPRCCSLIQKTVDGDDLL